VIDLEENSIILIVHAVSGVIRAEVMKIAVKRLIKDEKGKALLMDLILLVVGGLILTPLLGLMATGLVTGQVYEKKTYELYAADAGVEYGIWHLQDGGSANDTLEFTMNGKDAVVQMEELPHECGQTPIFEITSTATSADGSSTSILAQVTNIYVYIETGYLPSGEIIDAGVYSPGDLLVNSDAQIRGNTIVEGNLILNECSLIGGVVCVAGDLTLNEGAEIESDIYVGGNLLLQGGSTGSWVDGDVYVQGDVQMQGQSEILQNLWSGSNVDKGVEIDKNAIVHGDVHVRYLEVVEASGQILGEIYEDYYDQDCPLVYTGAPEILVWEIA
jgi:cytoskeletal protein CcmA (bactofilin family)